MFDSLSQVIWKICWLLVYGRFPSVYLPFCTCTCTSSLFSSSPLFFPPAPFHLPLSFSSSPFSGLLLSLNDDHLPIRTTLPSSTRRSTPSARESRITTDHVRDGLLCQLSVVIPARLDSEDNDFSRAMANLLDRDTESIDKTRSNILIEKHKKTRKTENNHQKIGKSKNRAQVSILSLPTTASLFIAHMSYPPDDDEYRYYFYRRLHPYSLPI